MSQRKGKVFMAFGKANESVEGTPFKKYIGIAPVFVLAVNPTKVELEKLYNTTLEKDLEYIGISKQGDVEMPYAKVDFIVKTDPEKSNGIELATKVTFFLNKEWKYNKDKTKIQVINKYGESTWLSIEDAKNKTIPENLSWFDGEDFRPAYVGEEELTGFLKAYLNIPQKSYRDKKGVIHTLPNPSDAEARLENVENYFKGDFKELQGIPALMPNNKVKVMFGIKTTDDNKQYQAVYTKKFLKNVITDYSKIDEEMMKGKEAGANPTTEFLACDLKEYGVEATTFTAPGTATETEAKGWF